MTAKMQAFADALLSGKEPSPAYIASYPDCRANKGTIARKAHKLSRHPEVAAYLAQERAKMAEHGLLTRMEKRRILATIARKKDHKRGSIEAIKVDNAMTGDNAPQKVEVFGLDDLLRLVRKGE
jgi:hypothetical protein